MNTDQSQMSKTTFSLRQKITHFKHAKLLFLLLALALPIMAGTAWSLSTPPKSKSSSSTTITQKPIHSHAGESVNEATDNLEQGSIASVKSKTTTDTPVPVTPQPTPAHVLAAPAAAATVAAPASASPRELYLKSCLDKGHGESYCECVTAGIEKRESFEDLLKEPDSPLSKNFTGFQNLAMSECKHLKN